MIVNVVLTGEYPLDDAVRVDNPGVESLYQITAVLVPFAIVMEVTWFLPAESRKNLPEEVEAKLTVAVPVVIGRFWLSKRWITMGDEVISANILWLAPDDIAILGSEARMKLPVMLPPPAPVTTIAVEAEETSYMYIGPVYVQEEKM